MEIPRNLPGFIFILLVSVLLVFTRTAAEPLPNLILIMADDMGYGDWGPYDHDGNPDTPLVTDTPFLDQMAAEGVVLTDFYVPTSVCSPVRSSLLTGRHPTRTEVDRVIQPVQQTGMPYWEITIAELLRKKGYATGVFGKWHLGDQPQYLPTNQGFDTFFGIPYSNNSSTFHLLENETIVDPDPDQAFLTQQYTLKAQQFITDSVANNQPFLVYMPHSAPHVPLYASPAFEGSSPRGIYGDVVREMDWSVGQILDQIDRLGVDQDTLILFFSDNGPWIDVEAPPDHPEPWRWDWGSSGPLRDGKFTVYEGGVRVPFIARWPGEFPAGSTSNDPVIIYDLFPTIASVVGAELPSDRIIDGVNIKDVLSGSGVRNGSDFVFYLRGDPSAIRSNQWKLHTTPELTPLSLYDLESDIGETIPVTNTLVTDQILQHAISFHCDVVLPDSDHASLNTPVLTSSHSSSNRGRQAVDGLQRTRWKSLAGENEWLYVDLGTRYALDEILLLWDEDFGVGYELQVSEDAVSWSTFYSESAGDGLEDRIPISVVGRYVRFQGQVSSQGNGYALWEFEIHGIPVSTTSNLALDQPVTTSSSVSVCQQGGSAVDGHKGSRWESAPTDAEWLAIDLGVETYVTRLVLQWGAIFGKKYDIQISDDGVSWITVHDVVNGNGGWDSLSLNQFARHIRVLGVMRNFPSNGYSLWEVQIEGGIPSPTPTPTATATPLPSATATATPLPSATATNTPLPSATATSTPLPTPTQDTAKLVYLPLVQFLVSNQTFSADVRHTLLGRMPLW